VNKRIRILIGKVGLDGHDVGARVVAKALADAGMEVIYTGIRQTPEQVVKAAIEEGVDVIGISILSGSHMVFIPQIMELLNSQGANEIQLIAGGIISEEDRTALEKIGVKGVFASGTSTSEIVRFVRATVTRP
jgi:methylmalonyl-CoA mutase C-terminal domain/subunit